MYGAAAAPVTHSRRAGDAGGARPRRQRIRAPGADPWPRLHPARGVSSPPGVVPLPWDELPEAVEVIAARLEAAGHRAYLVGGAVRDHLVRRAPSDYDLATDALPAQVAALFPGGVSDDAAFGRVLVEGVDVLTLRREAQYKDRRRPSVVTFSRSIRADLARRDFTVNALAVDLRPPRTLLDPFGGRADLAVGLLRTVGSPQRRFGEDALRVLRAVRLRAELGLSYHPRLASALRGAAEADLLCALSAERVRDELSRALLAPGAGGALRDLQRTGLLERVLAECAPMVGCLQKSPMHRWDVWEHSVRAVEAAPAEPQLRWAALLHDCGKPGCRTEGADGTTHFYGHEGAGERIARALLRRLRFPDDFTARVAGLVRHHMFSYGPETRAGAARRLALALGPGGVRDLLELRRADRAAARWGAGYGPEGERLLAQLRAIEEAGERFTLRDLAIDGRDVMTAAGVPAGPRVGVILRQLHQWVLDDAVPNRREDLLERAAAAGRADPGA